jgi:hypothetical protein
MSRRLSGLALVGVTILAFGVGGAAEAGGLFSGRHVKDGSVTGRDLRDNALTGRDVRNASLDPDLYDGVTVGPAGPVGETGPVGPVGGPGQAGLRGVQVAETRNHLVPAGDTVRLQADCPYNTLAVQGGVEVDAFVSDARMTVSAPLDDMDAWLIHLRNGGSAATTVRAYVVCIAEY